MKVAGHEKNLPRHRHVYELKSWTALKLEIDGASVSAEREAIDGKIPEIYHLLFVNIAQYKRKLISYGEHNYLA